ncbi:hypothetical protein [Gordonia rubripertincta]|uniref:hypothetical protein n=1 Tax=Gordonia rubripertincta TaxID=36822 RepID=UPI0021B0B8EE|nr:hypothetical protein [Gordonia rubripertincta]
MRVISAADPDFGAVRLLETMRPTTRTTVHTIMTIHAQIGAEPAMRFTILNI